MAFLNNTFAGGTLTNTVTTGNSGGTSGDAFNVVNVGASSTIIFDNTQTIHSTESCKITGGAASTTYVQWTAATATDASRAYFYLTALPTSDTYLIRHGVGGTRVASLHINAAGKLRLADASGTTGLWTAAATFPLNQWVRVELLTGIGATTSTGTISGAAYLGDSTSPIETVFSSSTANTGTANVTVVQYGKSQGSGAYATAFWIGALSNNDAGTSFIGPFPVAYTGASATPVTASTTSAASRGQSGASSTPVTVSLSADSSQGQSVAASSPVTASVSADTARGQMADASAPVTAATSADASRGQLAAVTAAVTATVAAVATLITLGAASTATTVTLTADATVTSASTAASVTAITATTTADVTRTTTATTSTPVTTSLSAAAARGVTVDGTSVFTVDATADAALTVAGDTSMPVTVGLTADARVHSTVNDRDLTVTIIIGPDPWTATIGPPNWTASIARSPWRAHIDPVEDPVYDTDPFIYTPYVTVTADHAIPDTAFLMGVNDGPMVAPDVVERTGMVAKLKLGLGTDGYAVTAGPAVIWVDVTDTPEHFKMQAGSFRVRVG